MPQIGAALENSPHIIKKNFLFVPRMPKKKKKKKASWPSWRKKRRAGQAGGKIRRARQARGKPELPPSPIISQRDHIDCGDDFAMLVPRVTDLAT